jgi:hypothetical protein
VTRTPEDIKALLDEIGKKTPLIQKSDANDTPELDKKGRIQDKK